MANIPMQPMNGGHMITTDAQVHIDIDGPTHSEGEPRYRKNRTRSVGASSSGQYSTGRRPVSYHASSDQEISRHLMQKLPSRQLADQVKQVLEQQNNHHRKKSKKRRPGYHTLRHHRGDITDMVDYAGKAANSLERGDDDFMGMSMDEQANAIKNNFPSVGLAEKKAIKKEVQSRRKKKSKKPGPIKRLKYSISLSWNRFKVNLAEVSYSVDLWRSHFKMIEGHFGTGVTSYFRFIKFLLLLNIPVFLLTLFFVVIPQLLYRYIEMPGSPYQNNSAFSPEQILTGGGWFNGTELYYGAYTPDNITIIDSHHYHMQYAYLCTTFGYYILILVITMTSLSRSYRKNYIESSQEFDFYYVTKVFSGWDFGINNPRAAELRHKSLFKEFQEYLSGFHKEDEKRTCSAYCGLISLRIFTNLLVLGLLAGSAYLVWYISITQSLGNDIAFLMEMALPLTISAINFILPFAFSIISTFEKYRLPQAELYITMLRTIVLNVCTLGVLIYFWFSSVDCSKRDTTDDRWLDSELECRPCWETFMGEQIYRLVIVDFIFILVITFLSEFVRRLMSQFCCKTLGNPEFNIGRNTLNLIYSQILIWVGTFYSPLLSFIQIFKLFVIFYVKRVSVTQNCVPSVKPWRGGRTHTVILGLMFAAFLTCLFAVGFSIVFLKPSEICGPYIGLDSSYQVLTNLFQNWQDTNPNANDALEILLEVITSFFFVVALFLILCVVAHWSRVVAKGHEEMTDLLRHQISMEGKDKMFLLRLLKEAVKNTPNLMTTPSTHAAANNYQGNDPTSPSRVFAKTQQGDRDTYGYGNPNRPSNNNIKPAGDPAEVYNPGFMDSSGEFNDLAAIGAPSMDPTASGEDKQNKKKKKRDKSKDRKEGGKEGKKRTEKKSEKKSKK